MFVKTIFQIIREIRDEGTTRSSSSNRTPPQALQLADRAYVLKNRSIVMSDRATALLQDPRVRAAYLGEGAASRLIVRHGPRPRDATPAGRRALAGRKERERHAGRDPLDCAAGTRRIRSATSETSSTCPPCISRRQLAGAAAAPGGHPRTATPSSSSGAIPTAGWRRIGGTSRRRTSRAARRGGSRRGPGRRYVSRSPSRPFVCVPTAPAGPQDPTDLYMIGSAAELCGQLEVPRRRRPQSSHRPRSTALSRLQSSTHVNYRTGACRHGRGDPGDARRQHPSPWDLAHHVGAVPLTLDACDIVPRSAARTST